MEGWVTVRVGGRWKVGEVRVAEVEGGRGESGRGGGWER